MWGQGGALTLIGTSLYRRHLVSHIDKLSLMSFRQTYVSRLSSFWRRPKCPRVGLGPVWTSTSIRCSVLPFCHSPRVTYMIELPVYHACCVIKQFFSTRDSLNMKWRLQLHVKNEYWFISVHNKTAHFERESTRSHCGNTVLRVDDNNCSTEFNEQLLWITASHVQYWFKQLDYVHGWNNATLHDVPDDTLAVKRWNWIRH